VDEAHVLRLALDGELTLSVNLVNGAQVRRGRFVPLKRDRRSVRQTGGAASTYEPTPVLGKGIPLFADRPYGNRSKPVQLDLSRHEGETLELGEELTTISGVWDLPMIGNERHDVERRYQRMCKGPDVTLVCWEGAVVERPGVCCQLQIRTSLSGEPLPDKIKAPYIVHPANTLPPDSVLVVRTSALEEFQARLSDREKPPSKAGGRKLAAWLAKLMRRRRLSPNKVHELTGLDLRTVKKILDGQRVRKRCLDNLANGLNVSISDIPTN